MLQSRVQISEENNLFSFYLSLLFYMHNVQFSVRAQVLTLWDLEGRVMRDICVQDSFLWTGFLLTKWRLNVCGHRYA